VRKLLKKNPKYSKRINYDALKELFVEGPFTAPELDEKKMDKGEMYTMDQDQDGPEEEMIVVVEEDGGAVGTPAQGKNEPLYLDEDAEGEDDVEGDVDAGGWEDTYEQEV
jgi:transcription factor IIIB 90 kDa subunit